MFDLGFVSESISKPYSKAMASTRLRVFDVVNYYKNKSEKVGLFHEEEEYRIVIFQKYFNKKAYRLAKELKLRDTKIVLDLNVNFFDQKFWSKQGKEYHYQEIILFMSLVDVVTVSSEYLGKVVKSLYPQIPVFYIEENIPGYFYKKRKKYKSKKLISFVYNGTAEKAREVLLIKDLLFELSKELKIKYYFICEKKPVLELPGVNQKFIKYSQKNNPKQLLKGDIYLAPRDMKCSYNLGHSFTKIGAPMAVGLPVIASFVPSYLGSPAVLLDSFDESWITEIKKLLQDEKKYKEVSEQGINYCQDNFSIEKVGRKYKNLVEYCKK